MTPRYETIEATQPNVANASDIAPPNDGLPLISQKLDRRGRRKAMERRINELADRLAEILGERGGTIGDDRDALIRDACYVAGIEGTA